MPIRLGAPVLALDAGKMHEIDTTNVEDLYSMWTVFHKCADSMEEGRRLENLSWRLWNRETFCCESKPRFPDTPTSQAATPRPQSRKAIPELSASVESLASTTADDYEHPQHSRSHSPPVHIQGLYSGKSSVESLSSSRGRGKPISSHTLERMVMSIQETKINQRNDMTGLPASITEAIPTPSIKLAPAPAQSRQQQNEQCAQDSSQKSIFAQRASHSSASTAPLSSLSSGAVRSQTIGSDTSAEMLASHSIVRGFGPNRISSSQRTSSNLTTTHSPVPVKSALRTRMDGPLNKGANFMLGGSSEDESSFDDQKSFRTSQSSLTAALKNSLPQQPQQPQKKMTSFKEEVESRTIKFRAPADEAAIDTDDDEEEDDEEEEEEDAEDEDDDVSESAIEDEDGSDWEDSATDSGAASPAERPLFQRVDSKPNLTSRRSLLTTMVHQSERAAALAGEASKSSPALRRSRATSKAQKTNAAAEEDTLGTKEDTIPRSKPIIMTTPSSSSHNVALSPRTTRRNMLSSELTESLRKNLLWERQQKTTTANAVLRRRHTAHDMANLQQYPENGNDGGSRTNSFNAFDHGLGEYNSRGW